MLDFSWDDFILVSLDILGLSVFPLCLFYVKNHYLTYCNQTGLYEGFLGQNSQTMFFACLLSEEKL